MPYVTAYYAPPIDDPLLATRPGSANRVIAVDDQGVEWHLTEDSQVGDWLRYVEQGGTVRGVREGKPAAKKKAK